VECEQSQGDDCKHRKDKVPEQVQSRLDLNQIKWVWDQNDCGRSHASGFRRRRQSRFLWLDSNSRRQAWEAKPRHALSNLIDLNQRAAGGFRRSL